ncbi:hypothetical protein ACR30L_04645 [Psychromonas sp. PT13]|uniref:hypothetical protein n=1 Tax=Psychromonas sp. PT13 TaxID=3439547 RepID=UPI003EBA66F8
MKHKLLISAFLTLLPLTWVASCTILDEQALTSSKLTTGFITSNEISEASGIAVSQTNPSIIWINNDSGNTASLYAVNDQGKHIATLKISGVINYDWEDLANFNYQGNNYLLIADTGDNFLERKDYRLHIIKEPKINTQSNTIETLTVKPQWSITFSYPDKPKDVESVAIDTVNKQILLLTKRDFPHQLYALPLVPEKTQSTIIADHLGEISDFPAPLKSRLGIIDIMNYSNMPTAMDMTSDDRMAVILTYSSAYLYSKKPSESWLHAFNIKPKRIDFPTLTQGEAIGFSPQGKYLYITSEKTPAPILKIDVSQYQ